MTRITRYNLNLRKLLKTFDKLFDNVIKHEGYYANVAGDKGGETYMGVARNLHPDKVLTIPMLANKKRYEN